MCQQKMYACAASSFIPEEGNAANAPLMGPIARPPPRGDHHLFDFVHITVAVVFGGSEQRLQ